MKEAMQLSGLALPLLLLLTSCMNGKQIEQSSVSTASVALTLTTYDTINATINARGTINVAGIVSSTIIRLYDNSTCIAPYLAQTTLGMLASPGVNLQIPATGTTTIYASPVGFGGCILIGSYTPSHPAPPPPFFVTTDPLSPSRSSYSPLVFGTTSGVTSSVALFSDANCSAQLATGTASDFISNGLPVALPPSSTTEIYGISYEPFGAASACVLLTSYTHSDSNPDAPIFVAISPTSPANASVAPTVTGTSPAGAVSVWLYSNSACSIALATGTVADFQSPGLSFTVGADTTTTIYARSQDGSGVFSTCTYLTTFVNDTTPPAAPIFISASPASPTRTTLYPRIAGKASTDTALVKLYSNAACSTLIGSGSKSQFEGVGVSVGVTANALTSIYAEDFDAAGNASACKLMTNYIHDTIPPDVPGFLGTDPVSPNNQSITPLVQGFTSADTVTVQLYSDEICTNMIGSGTSAAYVGVGVQVTVPVNTITTIYGVSIDSVGNASECTALGTYAYSNLPAPSPTFTQSVPTSPSNTSFTPSLLGTAASTVSTVQIYTDSACSTTSLATGSRATFQSSGISVTVPKYQAVSLYGKDIDVYGNVSPCTYLTTYVYDNLPPTAPLFSTIAPVSPNNQSTTPVITGSVPTNPAKVLSTTSVKFYDNFLCINVVGSSSPALFTSPGVTLDLPANTKTDIYAKSFDNAGNFSACTAMTDYVHDALTPGKPVFGSANPASPSYTRTTTLKGTIGTNTDFLPIANINYYSDANCSTLLTSSTSSAFTTTGVALLANQNTTTTIYGQSVNTVGNKSNCNFLVDYFHNDLGPSNLIASQNLNGSIALSWNPDTTASPSPTYIVKRSIKSGGPYTIIAPQNYGNFYVDSSVTNGATYYYVVAATNKTGTSNNSTAASVNVNINNPTGATSLIAIGGFGRISLTWAGFPDDMTFKVMRATQSGGPYTNLIAGLASQGYVDSAIANSTSYYYVVVGSNPAGDSMISSEASASAFDTPDTPQNLTLTPFASAAACGGSPGVLLNWSPAPYYTNFYIKRGPSSGALPIYASSGTSSYWDCSPLTNYNNSNSNIGYYAVSSNWDGQLSYDSNQVSFANRPAAAMKAYPGDGLVQLTWTNLAGANSYNIYRSNTPTGTFMALLTDFASTVFTDTAVANGTAYYYYVVANYGANATSWPSMQASAVPGAHPGQPTNLVLTTDTVSKGAKLDWTAPSQYNFFRVYQATAVGGPYTFIGQANTNTFTDSASAPGYYYYYVTAVWGTSDTSGSNIVSYRHGYPATLTAVSGTASVSLAWSSVSGASTYGVYRSTSASSGYTLLINTSTPTYSDTTITCGTGYYYQVKANFADSTTGESSPTTGSQCSGAAVPTGLSVTATTSTSVDIKWVGVSGATYYKVYKATAAAGPYTTVAGSVFGTSYTVTSGLTANTKYYFKVAAVVGGSTSAASAYAIGQTLDAVTAPTVSPGNASIAVSWTTAMGSLSYDVERSTDGVSFTTVVSGTTSLNYTDHGLINGQIYFYRVNAVYASGTATGTISSGVTPGIIPPVPAGLSVLDNSSGVDLTLSWGATSGATGYNLYMSTSSGSGYTLAISTGSNSGVTIGSLTTGQTYYFVVSATTGSMESGKSSEIAIVPTATPPAPTVIVQTNSKIYVSWPSVSGASAFDVERSVDGISFSVVSSNQSGVDFTDTTPVTGYSYYYRYTPLTSVGVRMSTSATSTQISFGVVPPAPPALQIQNATLSDIRLAWLAVPTATRYNIYRGMSSGGSYSLIGNVTSSLTTYTDSPPSAGVDYYYVVTTVNSFGGESIVSNEVGVRLSASVPSLTATPHNNKIDLSWTPLAGASSYTLKRGMKSGGPYGALTSGSALSSTDSNVSNARTYYYVVEAAFASGTKSSLSAEVSATAAVHMNLEVPIELTDSGLSSAAGGTTIFERTRTSLDTAAYDGTVTYSFEISAQNVGSSSATVDLVDINGNSLATISVPAGTNSLTRLRTAFTPITGHSNYRVALGGTTTDSQLNLSSARILVHQIAATKTRIYIPLMAGPASSSSDDANAPLSSTNASIYSDQPFRMPFVRRVYAYSQLADFNAWQFEALVAASGSASGLVSLYDYSQSAPVAITQTQFTESAVTLAEVPFSEGETGFGAANDGDSYGVSLICYSGCSGGFVALYKAGLWVTLSSLSQVEIPYRNALHIFSGSPSTRDDERTLVNLADFSNPSVYFQASVDAGPDGTTSTISLFSDGNDDSGEASLTAISGSALNFSAPGLTNARGSALTINSGERFLTGITPGASGVTFHGSSLVIKASP